MSQTTLQEHQQFLEGEVQKDALNSIRSYVNGEASAGIPFGVLVIKDLTDPEVALEINDGTGVPAGVVVRQARYEDGVDIDANDLLLPDTQMSVMDQGLVAVLTEEAITSLDDPVRVRHVVAGAELKGAFRSSADSTDTVPLNGAVWHSLGGAGSVVLLRLVGELSFGTPD